MTDVPALTAAMAILLAGGTLLAAAAAAASALDFAGAMRAAPLVGPLGRLALLLVGLALLAGGVPGRGLGAGSFAPRALTFAALGGLLLVALLHRRPPAGRRRPIEPVLGWAGVAALAWALAGVLPFALRLS